MDDETIVGVLDHATHALEQLEPFLDRQAARVAVFGDRFTVDILHREPRRPVVGDAARDPQLP